MMLSLFDNLARAIAKQIADDFGSSAKRASSGEYAWICRIVHEGAPLLLEVHRSGKRVRIMVLDFQNRSESLLAFGAPSDPALDSRATLLPNGPPVFYASALGKDGEEAAKRFCADVRNREDILSLQLQDEEEVAIYANQIMIVLMWTGLSAMRVRLTALARLYHHNNAHGKLKLFAKQTFLLAVGDVVAETVHTRDLRQFFGSLL